VVTPYILAVVDPPPLRSLLFTPANREARMRAALSSGADGVVFDLESAIPRDEADVARAAVRRVLDEVEPADGPAARFVRVCDVSSPDFRADVDAAMHPTLAGVLLPQVTAPSDVVLASALLDELDPSGRVALVPLVETASAVRLAYDIATSSARIAYFGAGVSRNGDIARAVGYRWTAAGTETLFLRSKVLIDARAAGVHNPITGIWGDVEDLDGLRAFAEQSRDLGYEGLMCIHPRHVPVIHEVFTPSTEELRAAARLLAAVDDAAREGIGAFRLDGRLVDAAHAHTARALLQRARGLGIELPA
jgi:citrate lyase subunit beta/citryl-CoA lyase